MNLKPITINFIPIAMLIITSIVYFVHDDDKLYYPEHVVLEKYYDEDCDSSRILIVQDRGRRDFIVRNNKYFDAEVDDTIYIYHKNDMND